jgi:hypothetical protein
MDKQSIKELSNFLTLKIIENTQSVIDKKGDKFIAYSTMPFAMPYGAIANKEKAKPYLVGAKDVEDYNLGKKTKQTSKVAYAKGFQFQIKDGSMWVVWLGGYADYKGLMRPLDKGVVNLTFTGNMLQNLKESTKFETKEVRVNLSDFGIEGLEGEFVLDLPEILFEFGFSEETAKKVAEYNIERGRDFLGLTDKDIEEVVKGWMQK